jgi:hypothetical protein
VPGTAVPNDEAALLAAWDAARGQPAWRRPLLVAAALDGGPAPEGRPLGELNARLLALAADWFTDRLDGVVPCAHCGERLELQLPVRQALSLAPYPPDPQPFTVDGEGWRVATRLPTPADLAAAAEADDGVEGAQDLLLGRLVVAVEPAGALADPAVVEAVDAALAERDPLGALTVSVACPDCGHTDSATVDVGAWWWTLAEARIRRIVEEVHRLARAYGWSEPEVLAVSPHRRAWYLELVA